MAQLKTSDILGEIAQSQPEAKPVNNPLDQEKRQEAKRVGASKPSPYQSDLREKLRKKTQFSLGFVPTFICEEFDRLADKEGMNKREYLYHLLRNAGADIPPYEQMDGRKL